MAMASITMLRRASSSLLPRRSLLAATSAALLAVDRSLVVPLSRRFSTPTCSDWLRNLDVEIDISKRRTVHLPGIPFKIENTKLEDTVILSRRYGEDEIVKAQVDLGDRVITMVVTISKESRNSELMFRIVAYHDRIAILNLILKKDRRGIIDDRACFHFDELNEELKEGFYKYVEMRGINLTNINTLYKKWFWDINKFMVNGFTEGTREPTLREIMEKIEALEKKVDCATAERSTLAAVEG